MAGFGYGGINRSIYGKKKRDYRFRKKPHPIRALSVPRTLIVFIEDLIRTYLIDRLMKMPNGVFKRNSRNGMMNWKESVVPIHTNESVAGEVLRDGAV